MCMRIACISKSNTKYNQQNNHALEWQRQCGHTEFVTIYTQSRSKRYDPLHLAEVGCLCLCFVCTKYQPIHRHPLDILNELKCGLSRISRYTHIQEGNIPETWSQTVTQQRVRLSYVFILDFDNASLGMRVLFFVVFCSVFFFAHKSFTDNCWCSLLHACRYRREHGAHDFSLTIFCVSNFVV